MGVEGIFASISHDIQPCERQCRLVDSAPIGVNDKYGSCGKDNSCVGGLVLLFTVSLQGKKGIAQRRGGHGEGS